MSLFKTKDPVPEVVNNHVERIVLEAKYNIRDLTRSEIQTIREALSEQSFNRYIYTNPTNKYKELLDKIKL
jgi:hypothetical protein